MQQGQRCSEAQGEFTVMKSDATTGIANDKVKSAVQAFNAMLYYLMVGQDMTRDWLEKDPLIFHLAMQQPSVHLVAIRMHRSVIESILAQKRQHWEPSFRVAVALLVSQYTFQYDAALSGPLYRELKLLDHGSWSGHRSPEAPLAMDDRSARCCYSFPKSNSDSGIHTTTTSTLLHSNRMSRVAQGWSPTRFSLRVAIPGVGANNFGRGPANAADQLRRISFTNNSQSDFNAAVTAARDPRLTQIRKTYLRSSQLSYSDHVKHHSRVYSIVPPRHLHLGRSAEAPSINAERSREAKR